MPPAPLPPPSFSPQRRWTIGGHVLLSLGLLLGVLVLANYLGARHFARFEWTLRPSVELSPVTIRVLSSLTNPVTVVVLFDRKKPLYSSVKELLGEYENRCAKLKVEYVDYMLAPGRAQIVLDHYRLALGQDGDRLIIDGGGKIKVVYAKDLSEFDTAAILRGTPIKRSFKGEQLITSALYSLIDPRLLAAYFVSGHNEHDPSDPGSMGYLEFARVLDENNVPWKRLPSLLTNDVPADCQLLIIAGPKHPFLPDELPRIEKYLNQGGRLFVLFDYRARNDKTGLEKILSAWGVEVGHDTVQDPSQSRSSENSTVVTSEFGAHPIVGPLRDSRLELILPRSIRPRTALPQTADAPKVVALVSTSPGGVARVDAGGPSAKVTLTGSIALMAAVEKGAIQGVSADRGATRMVIAGDALFLGNGPIELAGNRDFLRNAINWLLNRELLLEGIGPRAIKEYRVTITQREMMALRWILLGAFPVSALLLGWLVALRRRN